MRRPAALLVVLSVAVSVLTGATPARAASLSARIDEMAGSFPGGLAVYVADPFAGAPLYERAADAPVLAASLYKLALLAEAEHQVERGDLGYGDRIVIRPEDVTGDGSYFFPGEMLSLDDALEAMITVSDNGTALRLWRTLGPSNVNAYLAALGVGGFHVAVDESDDNFVTARALGTFLTLLAQRKLVSPAASDRMLARLERQQINDRLPALLPEGTVVAHKTGNLVGAVHDVGIVVTPRGQRVVVALTWDTDDATAQELIAQLGAAVWSAAVAPPVTVRYRLPAEAYAEVGSLAAFAVTVENAGDERWPLEGPGSVGLVWELRDGATGAPVSRSAAPLPLGRVGAAGRLTLPVVVRMPLRAGDHRLVLGLVDGSDRTPLASVGVPTAALAVKVHLPFAATADIRVPTILHRREASLIEVAWRATAAAGATAHDLALSWRLVDPATGRVVAQGVTSLGTMAREARAGSLFAPLVAPGVRGTFVLEHELREGKSVAGPTLRRRVEVAGPRTWPD